MVNFEHNKNECLGMVVTVSGQYTSTIEVSLLNASPVLVILQLSGSVLKLSLVEEPVVLFFNAPPFLGNVKTQDVPLSTCSVIVKVLPPVTVHFVSGGSANRTCKQDVAKTARNKRIFFVVFDINLPIAKLSFKIIQNCPLKSICKDCKYYCNICIGENLLIKYLPQ